MTRGMFGAYEFMSGRRYDAPRESMDTSMACCCVLP